MAHQISQAQVPDGMVANLPWNRPFEEWSDRMIERGVLYLQGRLDKDGDGEGYTFFPTLLDRLKDQAEERGIDIIS